MKRAIDRWSKVSPTFLQTLGIIFLAGYALPIINPNISSALHSVCRWTLIVIWLFFAFDYFARISIAEDKKKFAKGNLLDLAAVALPFLPLLRAIRALAAVTMVSRRTRGSRSQEVTTSVVTLAFATWFVAGLAVTDAERHVNGANIQGVGDGWWWAITTMSTVGYGDTYPISMQGRLVGTALMIMGVALLGTITASIASNFNLSQRAEAEAGKSVSNSPDLTSALSELDSLKKRMTELERRLTD